MASDTRAGADGPTDVMDRAERFASRSPVHLRGRNLAVLVVRTVRRFVDVRITGLAAEMTYYVVLSLLPLLTAIGAGLGLLERFLGSEVVEDLQRAMVSSVEAVFTEDLMADVVTPTIETLLREERAGLAIGGLLVSIVVASRVFRAAIRALDDAYDVPERRNIVQQWLLSLGFMAGAVVVVTVSLALVVVGPLLGGGQQIAEWLGVGDAFRWAWSIGRWAVVAAVSVGFLMWLYRSGPNVENRWRGCLPGALVATVGLIAVAVGFQAYLGVTGPTVPDVDAGDQGVLLTLQLLGILAATLLFVWLSNITVLLGGVINAEWSRGTTAPRRAPHPEDPAIRHVGWAADAAPEEGASNRGDDR